MTTHTLTIYKAEQDQWQSHIGTDINPVPADQFECFTVASGVVALNQSTQEYGGGLISPTSGGGVNLDYPIPAAAKFFGLDVEYHIAPEDQPHLAQNEMDVKCTFAGGPQANWSSQQNFANKGGMWQLDPTGSAWVDSGYMGKPRVGDNRMQLRFWSDGTKWSVTGLRQNDDLPFTPGQQFTNLPMISTSWGAGLHVQLQMQCIQAPWFLRQLYKRVWVLCSESAIPWD